MADEQRAPDPQPIRFVQYNVLVNEEGWPEVTTFSTDLLDRAHVMGATYDPKAGTLTFGIFNGGAMYILDPDDGSMRERRAVLVPGSDRKTTRRP